MDDYSTTPQPDAPAPAPSNDDPGLEQVLDSLARVRRRARLMLLLTRAGAILAIIVASALAIGLIDFALRFPSWIRVLVWLLGVGGIVWATVRYIRPAWRFRPSLTDLALRLERNEPALAGLLASAVDFARRGDSSRMRTEEETRIADALARHVVDQAGRTWRSAHLARVFRGAPVAQRASSLTVALVACIALLVFSPDMWRIGAERVLTPWTNASWPKRTGIVDMTGLDVHALGSALPLRAALTKSGRAPRDTQVAVRYRLLSGGRVGAARRELLTWQGRTISVSPAIPTATGSLFERLIEPIADAIEYRFETEDDLTPWRRIRLIEPPQVVSAQATITPPEYAAQVLAAREGSPDEDAETPRPVVQAREIDLGPGTDERAVAPVSLSGSRIEMTLALNRDVSLPTELVDQIDSLRIETFADRQWRLSWTLEESTRLPIKLVDEFGIESVDEVVYRFEALADRPPAATITQPESDRSVLATATIEAAGEGRDDVGLAWVSVEQEIWVPAGDQPSGPGGALTRRDDGIEIQRREGAGLGVSIARTQIDLSTLDVRPGDEIRLTAIAQDLLGAMSTTREPTRSQTRRLRVISEAEFVEEIREQLAEIRQRAQAIEQRQGELRERTTDGQNNSETRRGQAQLTERIARQAEHLRRLEQRVSENSLDDPDLEQLLDEAQRRLTEAGQASQQASEQLDEAAERADEALEGEEADLDERARRNAEEATEAAESQRDVQDALENLINLLDRGEDNWAVKRNAQRLLDQQRALRGQTRQLGQQTAGRQNEELTPQERNELDEIVERQNQLAGEMDELIREMRDREQELESTDPGAAQAMSQAAERAEKRQTSKTMRNAAQQADQNQTTRAQDQQSRAEEDLEELLENLDRGDRARNETLRRALKSVIESLEGLVAQQISEIARLDARDREGESLDGLDAGMIRLNQNTLGVLDLAQSSGAELGPVAKLIERAGDAQAAAISELRFPMAMARSVRGHEERSLEFLQRALEEAQELDEQLEQRQRDEKLRQLRQAYREILEEQVALREQTDMLTQVERITRRDRVAMRGLSEQQEIIRDDLAALVRETQELAESQVFSYAHDRLDRNATRAIDSLTDALPRRAVRAQRAVERGIRGILEALKDPEPDDSPFVEPSQAPPGGGPGGSGGAPPLLPPVKELTLLRDIQTDIAERTTELNDSDDEPDLLELIQQTADDQRMLQEIGESFLEAMEDQNAPVPGLQPAPRPDGQGDPNQPAPPGEQPEGADDQDGAGQPSSGDTA